MGVIAVWGSLSQEVIAVTRMSAVLGVIVTGLITAMESFAIIRGHCHMGHGYQGVIVTGGHSSQGLQLVRSWPSWSHSVMAHGRHSVMGSWPSWSHSVMALGYRGVILS